MPKLTPLPNGLIPRYAHEFLNLPQCMWGLNGVGRMGGRPELAQDLTQVPSAVPRDGDRGKKTIRGSVWVGSRQAETLLAGIRFG